MTDTPSSDAHLTRQPHFTIGRRYVVRRRLTPAERAQLAAAEESFTVTDVTGEAVAITAASVTLRTRSGEDVTIDFVDITASKPLPPAPPTRRPRQKP